MRKQNIQGLKVKCKTREIMGDCIGLHGLMTEKDIDWWGCVPTGANHKIPQNEIWIRSDYCTNNHILKKSMNITVHEDVELLLMTKYDLSYPIAHSIANYAEKKWKNSKSD